MSYAVFILIIGIFGKGFDALESLGIVLISGAVSILLLIRLNESTLFRRQDYIFIGLIYLLHSFVGVAHFITIINPEYFSENILGVSIENGNYYIDNFYFTYLMSEIAEFKTSNHYLSADPEALGFAHKNYFLAYLVSDLFYFGDNYVLNFMAINMLSIIYSGVLLSYIMRVVLENFDNLKMRIVFYMAILQPIAWVPSHSMRDILGAFVIILSVSFIYFSKSLAGRAFSIIVAMLLVSLHRSSYVISILGILLLQYKANIKLIALMVLAVLLLYNVGYLENSYILIAESFKNSTALNAHLELLSFFKKAMHLVIGPFPWTQYFDGSVINYASFYSLIIILQSSWNMTMIYFLIKKINFFLALEKIKLYFYIILLFSVPALFSLGGHNIYLLPSSMMAIVLMQIISLKRFLFTFLIVTCAYIAISIIYFLNNFVKT